MTEGSIGRKLLVFCVPLILGNLLQQLYNTADSVIVGNFVGSNALAAVGSSGALIYLLIAFSQGVSVGAGVVISHYLGADDSRNASAAVHTALAIVAILGVVLTAAGVALSRALLVLLNTPDDVMADSVTYLRIYFGGVLFNVVYNMTAGILNAAGNSRRSLLYLAIASVTNIVLDIVCVALLDMGVAGAAIATNVSQLLSCVLSMGYLVRVNAPYRVVWRELRIDGRMAGNIIRIGLPTGIQNMVISLSNAVVQSSVNAFGSDAMAGFGAYMKIDGFNILPVLSLSLAMTTFTGQNLGAGKVERVKKEVCASRSPWGWVIRSRRARCCWRSPRRSCGSLPTTPPPSRMGSLPCGISARSTSSSASCTSSRGRCAARGKSIPPMVIMLVSLCVVRIAWLKLVAPLYGTIDGVFIAYPITWAVGMGLMVLYSVFGKWLKVRTDY